MNTCAAGIAKRFTRMRSYIASEDEALGWSSKHELRVFDEDGTLLGYFKADLLIEDRLICEIKGAPTLINEHVAQLLGYLRASRLEHGLLINFGAPKLQI